MWKKIVLILCACLTLPAASFAAESREAIRSVRSSAELSALLDGGLKVDRNSLHDFVILEDPEETVRCLKILLDAGADPDAKDDRGDAPLFRLARMNSPPQRLEMLKVLLRGGANVDLRNREGETPLMRFGEHATPYHPEWDVEIVRTLLAAGADPNARTPNGWVPLFSWLRCSPECARLLLEAGARVDARTSKGDTALHCAVPAQWGRMESVRMLLAAGAEADLANEEGITPLMLAGQHSDPWTDEDDLELIGLLTDAGANVDARDKRGWTPLFFWIDRAPESVALLLEKGADPNAENRMGETALLHAVAKDRADIAEVLIDAGANPSPVHRGRTPLDYARLNGLDRSARFLESRGAVGSLKGRLPSFGEMLPVLWHCLDWLGQCVALALSVGASFWIVHRKSPGWARTSSLALTVQLPFLLLYAALVLNFGEPMDRPFANILVRILFFLIYVTGPLLVAVGGAALLAAYLVLTRQILRDPATKEKTTWPQTAGVALLALPIYGLLGALLHLLISGGKGI